eukprot:CAMPEP_0180239016 /NCGR_PEP_ID=MMETSP0987-20121128/31276_1 /TAXON_ID=697907 /ORGANISM="non described non described, Strain CCMP2293" /LENGTH=99 /DNA_ID=CAMNT_0022205657 /DNA_START=501 /DNA_END=801 /DNA_ORIENTATION=-
MRWAAVPPHLDNVAAAAEVVGREHVARLERVVLVEVVLQLVHLLPVLQRPGAVPAKPALLAHANIPPVDALPVPAAPRRAATSRRIRVCWIRGRGGESS